MPAASMDMFIASSAMIVIFLGALYGLNVVVEPYLGVGVSQMDRHQQIARYILLTRGEPEDWGEGDIPQSFGLASGGRYHGLDIDKVTRLNPSNVFALNYSEMWDALGIEDISFKIRIDTIFNVTLSLTSTVQQGENTTYTFAASTTRDGYPITTDIEYYVVIRNFTDSKADTTDDDGLGTISFDLNNTMKGTALLIAIAQIEPSIVTFSVLPFAHNAAQPNAPGSFATLSPLNYTLSYDLTEGTSVVGAHVFSLNYTFNLESRDSSYTIPHLLDPSPMVLVITGSNNSISWAEWVTYPQVPFVIGADMSDDHLISGVDTVTFLIDVKGALYRFEFDVWSPAEDG